MTGPATTAESDERLLAALAAAPPLEPELGQSRLLPGTIVGGEYRIESVLGRGGMGVVYRAHDLSLERPVAIKVHSRVASEATVGRLTREAKVMAKLSHANVLTIYEIGRHRVTNPRTGVGLTSLFIAMELVEGGTLRDWIEREQPDWRRIVEVYVAAGRGLAAAHRAGVIHRDFKPDNVLVDGSGRPRVADFGLARILESPDDEVEPTTGVSAAESSGDSLTRTGTILGTRAYMAPEQGGGASIDARADQYAFCVSLYEGLHGRRPHDVDGLEPESGERAGRRSIPARLGRALQRGLQLRPDDRFPSMDTLLDELERSSSGRRSWWVPTTAGLALALPLGWSLVGREPAAPRCDPEAELGGAWDDARRQQLRSTFAASGLPYAETSAAEAIRRLDAHAERWAEQRGATCRGDVEPSELDARRAECLGRRRDRLRVLVDSLLEGEEVALERAVDAVGRLPPPQECDRPEILVSEVPEPGSSIGAEQRPRLEPRVDRLEASVLTGDYLGAAAAVVALREELEASPLLDLRRRVEALASEVAVELNELHGAEEAADAALRLSIEGGDRARFADDAVSLAEALAWLGEVPHARRMLRIAEAAAKARPSDPHLRIRLARARGWIAWAAADFEEATEAHREALALTERELGADHPAVADGLDTLAVMLNSQGSSQEALVVAGRGLDLVARTRGASHPLAGQLHEARAVALASLGRNAEALAAIDDATASHSRATGRWSLRTLRAFDTMAGVLLQMTVDGRDEAGERAHALLTTALGRYAEHEPGVEREEGVAWIKLGQLQRVRGEVEPAIASFERGLALLESSDEHRGYTFGSRISAWSGLGEVYAVAGRMDESVAIVERALEWALDERPRHPNTARISLQLAMRLIDAERFDEAVEVGLRARQRCVEAFGERDAMVARADVQLARAELARGRPQLAIAPLLRAEELAVQESLPVPSLPGLRYLIAVAHHDAGKLEQSREWAARALAIWPADDDASYGTRAEAMAIAGVVATKAAQ